MLQSIKYRGNVKCGSSKLNALRKTLIIYSLTQQKRNKSVRIAETISDLSCCENYIIARNVLHLETVQCLNHPE